MWIGGTSVTWRIGDLGNLEKGGRGVGVPAAWATACLPYHPFPGLRPGEDPPAALQNDDTTTFQGADRWPLATDG